MPYRTNVTFQLRVRMTEAEIKGKLKEQFENITHIYINDIWTEVDRVYENRRDC